MSQVILYTYAILYYRLLYQVLMFTLLLGSIVKLLVPDTLLRFIICYIDIYFALYIGLSLDCSHTVYLQTADITSSNPINMITTIEVPHLATGQKIAEYKKVFVASTATLKEEQQLACLPLYIHRTNGERKLAYTAASKSSLKGAFQYLEDLIDGSPCVFTESDTFFNMKLQNVSVDNIRSYYFELLEVASRAKMDTLTFLLRFLTNIPND